MKYDWGTLFPTLDEDQRMLVLLFASKNEIMCNKFVQAVSAEANIRYEGRNGKNVFSYKFDAPCLVPPNDNKLKKDIEKLSYLGYVSSRVIIDPLSLLLKNAPRIIDVYTLTSESRFYLNHLTLNEREAEIQQLFKDILSESEERWDETWHDALFRYQQNFLQHSERA